jgi:hypothetical protein
MKKQILLAFYSVCVFGILGVFYTNCSVVNQSQLLELSSLSEEIASASRNKLESCSANDKVSQDINRIVGNINIRRLSQAEYVKALRAIFPVALFQNAELMQKISELPIEGLILPFTSFTDTTTENHFLKYFEVSEVLSKTLMSSPSYLNQLGITCWNPATSASETCLINSIQNLSIKTMGRELEQADLNRLLTMYSSEQVSRSPLLASEAVLMALLLDPDFLFTIQKRSDFLYAGTNRYYIDDINLAQKLSLALTGLPPDAELSAAAKAKKLTTDPLFYNQQATRLINSPAGRAQMKTFVRNWLRLDQLPTAQYNSTFLNGIKGSDLYAEATQEIEDFFEHLVYQENASVSTLLTSNYVFPRSTQLASIYKTATWAPGQAPLVANANERTGLITRVGLLLSGSDATGAFKRANKIIRLFRCESVMRPDFAAGFSDDALAAPPFDPTKTSRQRYENKTSPAACMACHATLNPHGFSLENYDGLGRYQTIEKLYGTDGKEVNQLPVNANVILYTEDGLKNITNGSDLSLALSKEAAVQRCFSKQIFRSVSGREEKLNQDGCYLNTIYSKAYEARPILELFLESVNSEYFKTKSYFQ